MVVIPDSLDQLSAQEVRELLTGLMTKVAQQDQELVYRQTKIDQLTHEMAVLKRNQFGRSREQLDSTQVSLLGEAFDEDLAAIEQELKNLTPPKTDTEPPRKPKRAALPDNLPRVDVRHEPDSTACKCGCQLKRIGEDVSEKLDYTPGVFTVERHVRGKWACASCETLTQAPVPPQVIDKGIPTAGLLAQVLVAKYADHLPLYRQEKIFGRAGLEIPRSTLGAWVGMCGVQLQPLVDALKASVLSHSILHADETPVPMLKPGNKKTHRAYLWAYAPGVFEATRAVVYDFCESRAGEHARVAKRLNTCVRESDTVARFGGDEFVIILNSNHENTEHAGDWVEAVTQKIITSLALPYQILDISHACTTSVGATVYTGQPCTASDLLKQADQAMYEAKYAGKNGYRFFKPSLKNSGSAP